MKCTVCGKEFSHAPVYGDDLCSFECHQTLYWDNRLDDNAIIIKGHCYHDKGIYDGYSKKPPILGHSGRWFKIKLTIDGSTINTNNLWDDGLIPEDRELPDNAEFLEGDFGFDNAFPDTTENINA